MYTHDLDTSVPDWVVDYPAVLPVLEELGIDYCCGGKSLRQACLECDLDPAGVWQQLQQTIRREADRQRPRPN
jgi:regulator of cell morphogenesis and NO signaling